MNDPYNFEDEDFEFDLSDFVPNKRISQMTFGEKLERFKRFFDSSSRAMLQDCLFRLVEHEDGTATLEILCPNELVQQRLAKKRRKINNTIYTCWSNSYVKFFSLCVEQNGEFSCQKFSGGGYPVD
jgi:hypothetical protein